MTITDTQTVAAGDHDEVMLTSAQVRNLFGGVSDMWLWRRLADPTANFPRPIMICRRRFWLRVEILSWRDAHSRVLA